MPLNTWDLDICWSISTLTSMPRPWSWQKDPRNGCALCRNLGRVFSAVIPQLYKFLYLEAWVAPSTMSSCCLIKAYSIYSPRFLVNKFLSTSTLDHGRVLWRSSETTGLLSHWFYGILFALLFKCDAVLTGWVYCIAKKSSVAKSRIQYINVENKQVGRAARWLSK